MVKIDNVIFLFTRYFALPFVNVSGKWTTHTNFVTIFCRDVAEHRSQKQKENACYMLFNGTGSHRFIPEKPLHPLLA